MILVNLLLNNYNVKRSKKNILTYLQNLQIGSRIWSLFLQVSLNSCDVCVDFGAVGQLLVNFAPQNPLLDCFET